MSSATAVRRWLRTLEATGSAKTTTADRPAFTEWIGRRLIDALDLEVRS